MKTKLKSLSKRSISVFLVLLMVVSTVTVGIFTTTAAFTEPDNESVGARVDNDDSVAGYSGNISIAGEWDSWAEHSLSSSDELTIDLSRYSNGDTVGFVLHTGSTYFKKGTGIEAEKNKEAYIQQDNNGDNNYFTVKNYSTIKIKLSWDSSGNAVYVKVTDASGSTGGTTYYIVGATELGAGGWDFDDTLTETSSGSGVYTYQMTWNDSNAGTYNFRVTDTDSWSGNNYGWSNINSTTGNDGNVYATLSKGDNDNNIKVKINSSCIVTLTFTASTSEIDLSFAPDIVPFDGYYLAGRIAVDNGIGTDIYPDSTANGYKWDSTNIKFTKDTTNIYKYETKKTVRQLAQYIGTSNDKEQNFVIYDRNHNWGDGSASLDFYDCRGDLNAVSSTAYAVSNNNTNEMSFNHSAHMYDDSDGKVIIWLDATGVTDKTAGTGTLKIYYTLDGETRAIADSVNLTASPSPQRYDKNMTLTASLVDANVPANSTCTYSFYDGTKLLDNVTSTTGAASYRITAPGSSALGVHNYNVVVSTAVTYTDGTGSHTYHNVTARADGEFIAHATYVSADLTSGVTPGYTASNWTRVTDNETAYLVSAANNKSTYTFALSSEMAYDTTFTEFSVDSSRTEYVDITLSHADVTINGEIATVRTYTFAPRVNCSGMRVYLDTATGKVYATANYNGTGTRTNTFSETETVRYYFAESRSYDSSSSGDSLDSIKNGIKIYYWNSSVADKNGYAYGTAVNINGAKCTAGSTDHRVYMDQSAFVVHNMKNSSASVPGGTKNLECNIYYCDLPIWATCFRFVNSSDISITSRWEVLNPNRVYCMFEYGTNKYVSSAVLDETLWSENDNVGTKNQNMTSDVLKVKTNLIKYKRTNSQGSSGAYSGYANDNDAVDANAALSTRYNTNSTAYPLYFGNYAAFTQSVFADGMPGQLYTGSTGFNMRWNLAQRGAPTGKDTDDLKYDGGCAYYASIWNLTGFLLDKSETNDIGGYYLTNPNNSNRMPLFDYSNLSDAATVYYDQRFPFYKSSYNGVTTYSYDSLADPNRLYSSSDYTIEDTVSSTYFRKVGNLPGYQPFSGQDASFANEFDINFYMTSTGAMTPKNKINGEDQDIAFNFSGDDDVWVYVDGVKVLDLGGDHMISAGSINFTKMKVYYKTAAETAATVASNDTIGYKTGFPDGYAGLGGSWAYSSDNVYTVNLKHLFDAAGVTFKNTDATTKHKLQMFYVERGQNESNLSLEFNLPQASGLSVKNSVTTGNVNPGLVNAAKGAASRDYFVYTVKDRLSTETDVNNTKAHGGIWSNVRSAASSVTGLSFSLPLFPANTNAVRDVEGIRYTLAKSGSSGSAASGYTAPTSTTSFTDVKNVNYYLSDENLTDKATDLSGQVGSNGELYLLSGQMANFRDSIGANTSLAVRQHVNLGEVQEDSNGIAQYSAVEKNDAGNYYITSYSITDDTTNTELQSRTGDKFISGTGDSLLALDKNTANSDSFYFSSYSADEDKNSPAMTVTYYNDVAVGDIKIQKAYDKTYADMSTNFRFTVEFANIFGDDENFSSLQEYDGLVYYVYDSNNNLVYETPKIYSPDSGIIIQAGQYALIKGVPVETRFKVTERTAANHELVSISKTARKSDGTPLNTVSGLAINSSTFYDESIDKNSTDTTGASPYDSWNGATAFSNKSTSDGYKDATASDDMIYYVNMIPNIAESKTGSDTSAYQSVSKIIFTNEKQKFSVVFKYYDRARINDEPAQINILPVTYTVNFDGLTEFTNLFTTETTVGTRTYQEGDFKSYDFKRLIQTAAVEFASDTNISNILDEYHMWKGQTEAVTALTTGSLRNVKENKAYSQADVLYHTNYIGEVQTASEASNERWVTYKNDKGVPLTDPYGFKMSGVTEEAYADGDVISYDAISSIVVWCYNQPKQYSVTVHKTTASDALSAKSVTLNGTSKTVYMSNNANTAVFNAYYNQRLGYEREYNDAGFFEQYGIEGYTNDLPNAEIAEEISSGGNTYKFAYWAFDALGTQVASTEIKYYYRVTNTVNLYPVYLPSSEALDVYGLSVLQDQQDTFVNSSGVSKTRLNLIFNPYGLHDYDSNILDSAVLNIIIQDNQRSQFADDDAIRTMFNNNKSGLQTYLNDHAQAIMTTAYTGTSPNLTYVMRGFEYTMKGNADDNGLSTNVVIQLTNKNRMQFTSIFNTATLYKTDQTQKVLQVTAMKYDDTWVISDNCVIDTFIGPVSTP